ncbi:MAG: hypothetical protein ACTHMY_09625, partial [Solirubrobacteraceae bacterium]
MIRQDHPLKTAVALSAITAALIVAGCGSSSSGKSGSVSTVRAAYISPSGPGYQIAMKVTGNAAGHAINVTGAAAFDQAAHAGRLTFNVSPATSGGENLQFNAVLLGKDVYVKLPASLAGKTPGGKPWLKLNLSEIDKGAGLEGLSSLENPGESPAHVLRVLRAASTGSVENLGQQTIDGVTTTGQRLTVDLSKVVDTLPAAQQPKVSAVIASIEKLTGLRYLPIETWVDSSHRVRRILLSESGRVEGQPFSENVQIDFVKNVPEPVPA